MLHRKCTAIPPEASGFISRGLSRNNEPLGNVLTNSPHFVFTRCHNVCWYLHPRKVVAEAKFTILKNNRKDQCSDYSPSLNTWGLCSLCEMRVFNKRTFKDLPAHRSMTLPSAVWLVTRGPVRTSRPQDLETPERFLSQLFQHLYHSSRRQFEDSLPEISYTFAYLLKDHDIHYIMYVHVYKSTYVYIHNMNFILYI